MLKNVAEKVIAKEAKINGWIESHMDHVKGPIYTSVDVRNAGFKIAPVDTNIFPGGFNNLCPNYLKKGAVFLKDFMGQHFSDVEKIIVIPENHSRNTFYFSNVKKLVGMIIDAGFEVKVGTLRDDFEGDCEVVETADGDELELCKLFREGARLGVKTGDGKFFPELLLLNNDLSDGVPDLFAGLSQPLIPSPMIGWHARTKSDHFSEYRNLIREFGDLIDVDPWFLESDFVQVSGVDFGAKEGMERIAAQVDEVVGRVAEKYKEYGIKDDPYVFVKNDAGTYGMAELLELNRKARNKMNIGKGNVQVGSVIVQEGVPTVDRFKGLVAEPVVYMVGNNPVGGFFRLNEQASDRANLNSKGMKFTKLCFHEMVGYTNAYSGDCSLEKLAKLYKLLAQIASIAAGYEIVNLSQ